MSATYEVWLGDQKGRRIVPCFNLIDLSASKSLNAIGQFGMHLPLSFDTSLIRRDQMIQLWRRPQGLNPYLWNTYFVRGWKFSRTRTGQTIYIYGPDINYALSGRVVAYYANETESKKSSDPADDILKAVVREAGTSSTTPATDYAPYSRVIGSLSVTNDVSQGPSISKAFAWEELLPLRGSGGVLNEVVETAYTEDGTELWWGIVPYIISSQQTTYEFRTWCGQVADARRIVFFAVERGNVAQDMWQEDFMDEVTYVYGAGQGQNDERNIQQVYDQTRILASMWNRREAVKDARTTNVDAEIEAAAQSLLREGRPEQRFQARLLDTGGFQFGDSWDVGTRVSAESQFIKYEPIIKGAVISLSGRTETIEVNLEYADDLAR